MISSLLTGLLWAAVPATAWHLAEPAWRVENVEPAQAGRCADRLTETLRGQGVQVMTSSEVSALLLTDQRTRLQGCEDSPRCLVEVGKLLGVEGMLVVRLIRPDENTVEAMIKVISTTEGTVIAETRARGRSEVQLLQSLDEAALAVAVALETARPIGPAPPEPVTLRQRALVPAVTGAVFVAIGAGLLVSSRDEFHDRALVLGNGSLLDSERQRQARVLAHDASRAQAVGWAGIGIGAGALAGAGLMYLLGSASPITVGGMAVPGGGGFGVSGNF